MNVFQSLQHQRNNNNKYLIGRKSSSGLIASFRPPPNSSPAPINLRFYWIANHNIMSQMTFISMYIQDISLFLFHDSHSWLHRHRMMNSWMQWRLALQVTIILSVITLPTIPHTGWWFLCHPKQMLYLEGAPDTPTLRVCPELETCPRRH